MPVREKKICAWLKRLNGDELFQNWRSGQLFISTLRSIERALVSPLAQHASSSANSWFENYYENCMPTTAVLAEIIRYPFSHNMCSLWTMLLLYLKCHLSRQMTLNCHSHSFSEYVPMGRHYIRVLCSHMRAPINLIIPDEHRLTAITFVYLPKNDSMRRSCESGSSISWSPFTTSSCFRENISNHRCICKWYIDMINGRYDSLTVPFGSIASSSKVLLIDFAMKSNKLAGTIKRKCALFYSLGWWWR